MRRVREVIHQDEEERDRDELIKELSRKCSRRRKSWTSSGRRRCAIT